MKTKSYLLSALALVYVLTISCNKVGKPLDFDYGKIENNKYTNTYFNCEMSIPKDWVVQSEEQMNDLSEQGQDLVAGDNAATKAMLKASEIKTANLLAVFKYEVGTPVDFNPNFIVVAENVSSYPGIKTGSDYLYQTRKLLTQTQLLYEHMDSTFAKEEINNTTFYSMNAVMNALDTEIKQTYYSAIIKDFSFNIVMTYNTDEQKQELISTLNTLKFN